MNKLSLVPPAASLSLDWKLGAIIGRRAEQQDAARAAVGVVGDKPVLLVVVADGMGGAVGGRLASTVAVAAFEERFLATARQDLVDRLMGSLQAANSAITLEVRRDRSLQGMGCTLVAVVTDGSTASWISVGDSLLLVANPSGSLDRLNADHSLGALLDEAAKRGEISRRDAETSHQRNMLRSALTGDSIAMIDRGRTALKTGAKLLLATDGVLTLSLDRIRRLTDEASSAATLTEAILKAVESQMPDDQDNLTVAVIDTAPRSPLGRPAAPPKLPVRTPIWAKLAIGLSGVVFILSLLAIAVLRWPMLHGHAVKPGEQIAGSVSGKVGGVGNSVDARAVQTQRYVTTPIPTQPRPPVQRVDPPRPPVRPDLPAPDPRSAQVQQKAAPPPNPIEPPKGGRP